MSKHIKYISPYSNNSNLFWSTETFKYVPHVHGVRLTGQCHHVFDTIVNRKIIFKWLPTMICCVRVIFDHLWTCVLVNIMVRGNLCIRYKLHTIIIVKTKHDFKNS